MQTQQNKCYILGMGINCSIANTVKEMLLSLQNGISGVTKIQPILQTQPAITTAALIQNYNFHQQLIDTPDIPQACIKNSIRIARSASLPVQTAITSSMHCMQDISYGLSELDSRRIGIVLACDNSINRHSEEMYHRYHSQIDYLSPRYLLNSLSDNILGILSQIFQIHGPGLCVGGISASANIAAIKAMEMIKSGQLDACLVVGTVCELSTLAMQGFINANAVDISENTIGCYPFDKRHQGFIYGQGAGALLLGSQHAKDKLTNMDCSEIVTGVQSLAGTYSAEPSLEHECYVMQKCLDNSSLLAKDINYINTHGTSTPYGDKIEASAIETVFSESLSTLKVNSTKALTGHCLSGAGAIELIASVLQVEHGFCHPNINLTDPINPKLSFVGTTHEVCSIRYALSNSFGFFGTNSSILLAASQHEH